MKFLASHAKLLLCLKQISRNGILLILQNIGTAPYDKKSCHDEAICLIKPTWYSCLIGRRIEVGWLYYGDEFEPETVEWCRGIIVSFDHSQNSRRGNSQILCTVDFDGSGPSLFEIDIGKWSIRKVAKHWDWRLLVSKPL